MAQSRVYTSATAQQLPYDLKQASSNVRLHSPVALLIETTHNC